MSCDSEVSFCSTNFDCLVVYSSSFNHPVLTVWVWQNMRKLTKSTMPRSKRASSVYSILIDLKIISDSPRFVSHFLSVINLLSIVFFIDVKLCLKDQQNDPTGDMQKPLSWKKQTIKCSGNEERTFLYFEYRGNDVLQLTKRTIGDKPLYNNQLCQLEFQVVFSVRFWWLIILWQFFSLTSAKDLNAKHGWRSQLIFLDSARMRNFMRKGWAKFFWKQSALFSKM